MRRRRRGTAPLERVSTAIVLALVVGWSPTAVVASPAPAPDARAVRRDAHARAQTHSDQGAELEAAQLLAEYGLQHGDPILLLDAADGYLIAARKHADQALTDMAIVQARTALDILYFERDRSATQPPLHVEPRDIEGLIERGKHTIFRAEEIRKAIDRDQRDATTMARAPAEPELAEAEAPAEPELARPEAPIGPDSAGAEPAADDADAASSEPPAPAFKVGGELVFAHNVSLSPLDRTGGAFVMNRFGVRLGGSYGKLGFFAKYLFQDFGHYPRVGYLSYQALPSLQLQAGIINHPFGPSPFLTDGFIFGLAYLVGLEDDADAGVKLVYQHGGFDLRLAYMHSDERGGSSLVRWGADLVKADIDRDGEPDGLGSEGPQASARLGYALERSNGGVEFALSGRGGMIVERDGVGRGSHVAGGAHLDGHWRDRFRIKLFGSYQDHFTRGEPVVYGAIGAAYAVAPRIATGQANVSWTEREVGKLDSISVYNDFSAVFKALDGSRPTMINVAGLGFRLGPAYLHVEWLAYQNHPLFDSNGLEGLTIGPETGFSHRLTTTLGFEFL